MENFNTDTQQSSRDSTRDSVDYWSAIDYQRLLAGKIESAKTDEDLHDTLGLGDRGLYHMLKAIGRKRNNNK